MKRLDKFGNNQAHDSAGVRILNKFCTILGSSLKIGKQYEKVFGCSPACEN